MPSKPTLSDTLQPTTICILSPVRSKEATFVKLGELQTRTIRLVHGDLPEHAVNEEFEETTYVAQLSLHLTHCDELIRLPLIILEEESHFDFSYNLTVDFREESELMHLIMPHFSSLSIYHYDQVQCDINIFELIAAASADLTVQPTKVHSGEETRPTLTLKMDWAADTPDLDLGSDSDALDTDAGQRYEDGEGASRRMRDQLNTIIFAPLSPTKSLARKVATSVRRLTNRQKAGHKRTPSNSQLLKDTIAVDDGHWDPKPSCSYESTVSIDLGSYDD